MTRIDFVRLRKRAGMSQRELADLLQVRPSFLSAIENGKSRMPDEKLDKIKEIFELDSLDDYMVDEHTEMVVPPHTHTMDQNDTLAQLLNHFHDLAHQREREHSGQDADIAARLDFLTKRNDRLSERIDDLRDEVDALRQENLRLKELLLKNGIQY
ncbi:MAG: helix-turn-helix domain-containing protein [Muribaculaceae bacterium]|nr:helix-turn-helix domain-containing protein [Muribaculaceae bacterium]